MDDLLVRYLPENEYGEWDSFIDNTDYGTIYHKSSWNRALYQLDPAIKISAIGCYKQGKIVGGLMFGWKTGKGNIKLMVPPESTCFYGMIFTERETNYVTKSESSRYEILDKIILFLDKDYNYITFSLPPEINDIRPFNWHSYSSRVMYTYRGDISNPKKILDGFLPDVRRRIKKGEEYDYSIRESKETEHLKSVYSMLSMSFSRQEHAFRFNEAQFISVLNYPGICDHINVFSISFENIPVASIVTVTDGKIAYYWMAGGDHNYFNTGLNQVLFWKVVNILSEKGILLFDLAGANTLTISNYKSSFNFKTVPYYNVTRVNGKFLRFIYNIKSVLTDRAT